MQHTNGSRDLPARTHAEAAALFRRPFAPGAIGFRAMTKVPYNGDPFGGAQVAAYIGGQSVMQRMSAVVPGRWRQEFRLLQAAAGAKKRYMCTRIDPARLHQRSSGLRGDVIVPSLRGQSGAAVVDAVRELREPSAVADAVLVEE